VFSLFLSLFSTFDCVYNCHPYYFGCLINLLHTSNILLVRFLTEFTTMTYF